MAVGKERFEERFDMNDAKSIPVLQLKLSLRDSDPLIWRRIIVPTSTRLHGLHRMIQILMQWWDYHLYCFEFRGEIYEEPGFETTGKDSTRTKLANLRLKKGDIFTYTYDYGDNWIIDILVEKTGTVGKNAILPWLIDGERSGPPEDCGGIPGLENILKVCRNRKKREYRDILEWLGDDYDPERFDRRTINHFLVLASAWLGLT
ncbi:MAG TPA: plasmid pRiA4b ORF-3 family protein [Aequorivita sp.]|nr:plasmid pRiA4b ORF-3 family protein [Aequorivita sp.]